MPNVTKKSILRFIFISIIGILLHFTYQWSGCSPSVALFSAVNESTWEHLKLLFFPMLLLTLIEIIWYMFHNRILPEGFLSVRTIGILAGMSIIVAGFYTISGILGRNYDFINIALYFAGVIYALRIENKLNYSRMYTNDYVAITLLAIITVSFFTFTLNPPGLGIFRTP